MITTNAGDTHYYYSPKPKRGDSDSLEERKRMGIKLSVHPSSETILTLAYYWFLFFFPKSLVSFNRRKEGFTG